MASDAVVTFPTESVHIDFDQLFENIVSEFPGGVIDLRLRSRRQDYKRGGMRKEDYTFAGVQTVVSGIPVRTSFAKIVHTSS